MARISDETHTRLKQLAAATRRTQQDLLAEAVARLERSVFFDAVDAAFAKLREDPDAWAVEERERALWDVSLTETEPD